MKNSCIVLSLFFSLQIFSQTNIEVKQDSVYFPSGVDKIFYFDSCKNNVSLGENQIKACFNKTLRNFILKELTSEKYDISHCEGSYKSRMQFVLNEKGEFEDVSFTDYKSSCKSTIRNIIKKILKKTSKIIPAQKVGKNVKVRSMFFISLSF